MKKRNKNIALIIVLFTIGCKNADSEKIIKTNEVIDGKKEGIHTYHSASGIDGLIRFKDGKRAGQSIYYFADNTISQIENWENDTLEGQIVNFFANGKVESIINYTNGVSNGMAYYYYESGVIESYRKFINDTIVGYGIDYYDTLGRVKSVMLFDDGGCNVYRKDYDKNGNLINEFGNIDNAFVRSYFNNLKSGNVMEF